jgi:hypothetical protein
VLEEAARVDVAQVRFAVLLSHAGAA